MKPGRLVLALHAGVAATIVVTGRRAASERLYNTRGGLSRAAVFGCYPTAIAAIAVLPRARRRNLAAAALPLCATLALPGMVDEHDLNPRPRNLLPLLGVGLAAAAGEVPPGAAGSRPQSHAAIATVLAVISVPWLIAELGLQTRGMRQPTTAEPGVDRVHLGHHEGLDGALLAIDGLVLARYATGRAHRLYLALMVAYGCEVAAQDAWHEHVVKRGWATRRLPDGARPRPGLAWAGLLAITPLVERLIRPQAAKRIPGRALRWRRATARPPRRVSDRCASRWSPA
jgi:hypothetical protein